MKKIKLLRDVTCATKILHNIKNGNSYKEVYIDGKNFSMEKAWQNLKNSTNFAKLNPHQKVVCRMALQKKQTFHQQPTYNSCNILDKALYDII